MGRRELEHPQHADGGRQERRQPGAVGHLSRGGQALHGQRIRPSRAQPLRGGDVPDDRQLRRPPGLGRAFPVRLGRHGLRRAPDHGLLRPATASGQARLPAGGGADVPPGRRGGRARHGPAGDSRRPGRGTHRRQHFHVGGLEERRAGHRATCSPIAWNCASRRAANWRRR